ncbi:hypothetical protein DF214_22060 [Pectobacterium atrosepticum]|nr:hypothetical protein CVS35_10625 [Pectobacterium atrosepticum]PWD54346.1 hypothetical protein DF214_22060 [Pectobacterium atrosepticum]
MKNVVLLKTIVKTDNYKQKSLPEGGLSATFRFFSYAQSPLSSGAKVKKETENSSVHTCVTLIMWIIKSLVNNK